MANITQSHFRFGKEELLEATHGWWQNEDVNHSQLITGNWTFLLRFCEQVTTAVSNVDAQFQYNWSGAGWVNITTTSSVVKAVASVAFLDGANCTKGLSGTGTFESSGSGCTEDGLSGGTTNDIVLNGNSETEAALQVVYANVVNGDTIQFRLTSPDGTMVYSVTPTLTIQKADPKLMTPTTLDTVVTLYIPTVTALAPALSTPTTLNTAITLYETTVTASDSKLVTPDTLDTIITLYTPDVSASEGGAAEVTPDTLNTELTLFVPVVFASDNKVVTPDLLETTTTYYVPSVAVSDNTFVEIPLLELIATTYEPVVTGVAPVLVTPDLLETSLTMYEPSILCPVVVVVPTLVLGGGGSYTARLHVWTGSQWNQAILKRKTLAGWEEVDTS